MIFMTNLSNNNIKIDNFEEIKSLLIRIYDFETQIEISMQWEAYFATDNQDLRDTLFNIIHELQKDGHKLKNLLNIFKDIDIGELENHRYYINQKINFEGMNEEIIVKKLVRNKIFIRDLYIKARDFIDENFLKTKLNDDNIGNYYETLSWLAEQKNNQFDLLVPFAGQVERIA